MSRHVLSVQALAECYNASDVVVIDCRFALADPALGERHYAEAHIPGAVYLHLDRDLSGEKGPHGGRHPLPDVEVLAAKLASIGVRSAPPTRVVVYDDSRFGFAARLWWLLRYLGHEYVQILDGGFAAWRAAGLSVSNEVAQPRSAHFVPRVQSHRVVDIDYVKTLNEKAGAVLVDSREERRYLGLEEPIDPIAGHIPCARNFPWQQVTDDAAQLRSTEQQRQRWGAVAEAAEIVVYCGSGVTACVNLLALAEIGRDDAKLYAGSWSDWCSYQ
ncbi:MAG: sulfurtransferase [Spongiibacteraceae bacterium]